MTPAKTAPLTQPPLRSAGSRFTVSVIVTAYNVERFIEACLAAVLEQLRPDHELIVIDDGSRDGTAARIRQLRAAHGGVNFHFIEQANQGVSAARNASLALARGD